MATHEGCRAVTAEAGSAISQFRFIVTASDGQVDHVGTAQGHVDGISGEAATGAGKQIPMIVPDGGIAKVECGAAVTKGGLVTTDNAGKCIDWVDAAGNKAWGRSKETGANGQIIEILFSLKTVGAGS